MKRGKPLQGLKPGKAQKETVSDMRCASDGRGLDKKPMVGCNGQYMPTYPLCTINMLMMDQEYHGDKGAMFPKLNKLRVNSQPVFSEAQQVRKHCR